MLKNMVGAKHTLSIEPKLHCWLNVYSLINPNDFFYAFQSYKKIVLLTHVFLLAILSDS